MTARYSLVLNGTTIQELQTGDTLSGVIAAATNLAGGGAGYVPYQSGADTTGFVAAGSAGQVLTSNGTSAPTWETMTPGITTGKSIAMAMIFGF